jgi:N-hydroxyarylamine O-acetyltransferase
MSEPTFDLGAYLDRIGLNGRPEPTMGTLRAVVLAHSLAIPYENMDVLLGKPPKLDIISLQTKMVGGKRGGYCFEQNLLLRAGLQALGFSATGLIARVVRGGPADAPRWAAHMAVRVDFPEGPFLVDVGFGNLTPTGPVAMVADIEQDTPHGVLRLLPVGTELVLQAKLGETWENLWRLCSHLPLDVDYDVSNWFTATYPSGLFLNNMIAARPGPDGMRYTFFNGRLNVRFPDGTVERQDLLTEESIFEAVSQTFGLTLPMDDIRAALRKLSDLGRHGVEHPLFS